MSSDRVAGADEMERGYRLADKKQSAVIKSNEKK